MDEKVFNLLIEENLDFVWSCYANVNTVDKEILNLMAKADKYILWF